MYALKNMTFFPFRPLILILSQQLLRLSNNCFWKGTNSKKKHKVYYRNEFSFALSSLMARFILSQ